MHIPCLEIVPTGIKDSPLKGCALITSKKVCEIIKGNHQWCRQLSRLNSVYTFGEETAESLKELNLPVKKVEVESGEQLARYVANHVDRTVEIHFLGASKPVFDYQGFFSGQGFEIHCWPFYETRLGVPKGLVETIDWKKLSGVICFASPSAVKGFLGLRSEERV